MHTYQETFDRVITHLKTQGRRALLNDPDVPSDSCAYRDGPRSCAVGCLIPDELYDPKMETRTVAGLVDDAEFPVVSAYLNTNFPLGILVPLQQFHDAAENWRVNDDGVEDGFSSAGYDALRELAAGYQLTIPAGVLPVDIIRRTNVQTNQETFDTVLRHLQAQGQRATMLRPDTGTRAICAYRTPEGRKCAIGCLIPDELYDPKMETLILNSLLDAEMFPELAGYLRETFSVPLLKSLQALHDDPENWNQSCGRDHGLSWVGHNEIREIASEFLLTVPPDVVSASIT